MAVTSVTGQTVQPEADNTVTRIHGYTNGSAEWTIRIRTRLDTDERVAEYEAFQEQFRRNKSRYLGPFRQRITAVVANAANATGRQMRATGFTASTSIQEVPRRWGVVTYRFTWTGFATQRDGSLVAGDIFRGGFFLAANDTLAIEAPAGYEITRADPTPDSRDDGVVTWSGREDFSDRHPRVVFSPATDPEQSGEQSPPPDGKVSSPFEGFGPGITLGTVLLLAIISAGAYVGWRRRNESNGAEQPVTTDAGSGDPTDVLSDVDGTVLTDSERVQELLEANGGRIRQAAIAEEFDWSASKTSRVVGTMVDEGTVEKLKLGRENLIELADADD